MPHAIFSQVLLRAGNWDSTQGLRPHRHKDSGRKVARESAEDDCYETWAILPSTKQDQSPHGRNAQSVEKRHLSLQIKCKSVANRNDANFSDSTSIDLRQSQLT